MSTKVSGAIVRRVPVRHDDHPRVLGGWEGKAWIADDFDAPDPASLALFEGAEPPKTPAKRPKR